MHAMRSGCGSGEALQPDQEIGCKVDQALARFERSAGDGSMLFLGRDLIEGMQVVLVNVAMTRLHLIVA